MNDSNQQSNPNPSVDMSADVKDFHKLHPNRKLGVFAFILFVFIVSIVVGVMMARDGGQGSSTTDQTQNQDGAVQLGETVLRMEPSASSVAVNGTITVTVFLENTAVQASDIAINYDPTMFAASNIVNGTVYDSILKSNIDKTKGQLVVNAAVSASNPQDLRTGDTFTFTLTGLKAGSGELSFDQDLTITAKNGINTLGSAEPVKITVQ